MKTTKSRIIKELLEFPSRRKFRIFFSDCGPNGHPTDHTIQSIIRYSVEDDYEWAHAIMDRFDDLLDLGINETIHFYPNRDDINSIREHALIKRIL